MKVTKNDIKLKEMKDMDGMDFTLETHGGPTPSMNKWIENQIKQFYNPLIK